MKFDDIFNEVGGFGKYQIILVIWICLLTGWPSSNISNIYFLMELPFACSVNESNGSSSDVLYLDTTNVTQTLASPEYDSQCRYSGNDTVECTEFIFDHSDYGRSAVAKYELVCSRSWLKSFGNTMSAVGKLFGTLSLGHISDRFGRMRTVLVSGLANIVFWSISIAAPHYPMYAVGRLLSVGSMIGTYAAGYVYLMEMVAPSKRLLVGQLCGAAFNFGYMLLSGFAFAVKDSIYSDLLCLVPTAILLLFALVAPESVRWLLVNNQQEKAEKVLNQMKRINNHGREPVSLDHVVEDKPTHTGTLIDVFRSKVLLKRTCMLISYWMAVNLMYAAMVYNSKALLPGNYYVNNFVLAAVGMPATVIGLVLGSWKRTGRRLTCCLVMMLAGILGFICIPCTIYGYDNAVRILAIIGKLFVGVGFDVIYLYTTELFPTEVRSSAMGFCSTCGRIGAIVATFAGREMKSVWLPLPYVVFGLFGTISGSLILLLPETLNKKLNETIQEVEEQYQMVESANDEKPVAT